MRYVTHYLTRMIQSIRHKGLKRLHKDDDSRGVIREHAEKPRDIPARLDAAGKIADMDVPGFRLHPLKGEYKGFWAVIRIPSLIPALHRVRQATVSPDCK
jgi:proteic killer suppression protein